MVEIKNSGGSWGSPYSAGNTDGDGTFFESVEFTVGMSDGGTESHTFGTVPRIVMGVLRCLTIDQGYAVDDELPVAWSGVTSGNRGVVVGANSSEVFYSMGSNSEPIAIIPKGGGGSQPTAPAKWALVIRAWK